MLPDNFQCKCIFEAQANIDNMCIRKKEFKNEMLHHPCNETSKTSKTSYNNNCIHNFL